MKPQAVVVIGMLKHVVKAAQDRLIALNVLIAKLTTAI
jgi:hypothetical protein